ncbi:aspartic-type endopeptidase [Ophiostoma piceae UAMH 11346]|uniref:Aspartic-type endopeptidase n=1 Tax=Ophiostoma piceae (strain UAMH 11346) TaxID=1262450 RepID=S3BX33_OPHP1|nr:aspartic-type endopeptidase [Ophiostoma piceae UAMH 11346]
MSCAPYPVEVRLGNVTLPTNQVVRGMNMSIGEPPQPIALLPLWPLNNTIIYGTNGYCLDGSPNSGTWTDTACATFRGGAYDSIASNSKTTIDSSVYPNDTAPDDTEGGSKYPQVTHVADTLTLNDNVTLSSFPFSVALSDWGAQAYTPMMGIGLGTNSTLLNFLKSTGKIASRSYSYFWGLTVAGTSASSLDGSVVFGGYDKAKVAGTKYTQAMTDNVAECPSQLLVTVSDIVLNFANGTDASIFSASKAPAFLACLTPGLSTLMRLPLEPYFDNMMTLTKNDPLKISRSLGVYYWNMRYESTGYTPYQGDMTIKLQSGLSVRIANNQLVRPHTEIDQTTGTTIVNATAPDLVIDSLQNSEAEKLPQIGWQFFTAAYLHVNQDSKKFTLWQANPTTTTNLVAVDSTGQEITSFCAEATEIAVNTTAPVASIPKPSSSPPVAAIAGSVVAGVVVSAIAIALWWFYRRRSIKARNAKEFSDAQLQSAVNNKDEKESASILISAFTSSELEGESVAAPAELYAGRYSYSGINQKPQRQTRYEMPG